MCHIFNTTFKVRRRRLARLNQGGLSASPTSDSQPISMRTNLKPVTEDSPVDTQDSGYGSLQQSFDIDDHSQETGDKCGKRTSPTSSSSPSESCKFKRTKDAFDKDGSGHVKVSGVHVRRYLIFHGRVVHGFWLRGKYSLPFSFFATILAGLLVLMVCGWTIILLPTVYCRSLTADHLSDWKEATCWVGLYIDSFKVNDLHSFAMILKQ